MATKTLNIPVRERAINDKALADVSSTWNKEDHTVNVVFATNNPVYVNDPEMGEFYEELGFGAGMMIQDRIRKIPVLDNHSTYSHVGAGVENTLKMAADSASMTLKVWSKAEDIVSKLDEGIISGISARFRVYSYQPTDRKIKGLPVYIADQWEPVEISFATIPADAKSRVRGGDNEERNQVTIKIEDMADEKETPELKAERERKEKEIADNARNLAITAERERTAAIRKIGTEHNLPAEFVEKHIADGTEVSKVGEAVLEHLRAANEKGGPRGGTRVGGPTSNNDERERLRFEAQTEAILVRMNSRDFKPTENNEYSGMSLAEHARTFLEDVSEDTDRYRHDKIGLIKRAMQVSEERQRAAGGMTRADFGSVYLNALDKNLLKQVEFWTGAWAPITYNQDAAMIGVNSPSIKLGEFGAFTEVGEDDEYPLMTNKDAREDFVAKKRGGRMGISFEMMANDDLGAMNQQMSMFAQSQAFTEDDIVWAILSGTGPVMKDGHNLFDATNHLNYVSSGTDLDLAGLGALYQLARNQTYFTGRKIMLDPQFLIVGSALEVKARQITSANYTPVTTATIVPDFLKSLKVIVSPKITDKQFILAANPARISLIRTGGVTGQARISFDEKLIWKTDQLQFKARHIFGAAPSDYRGFYKNVGL